MKNRVLTLAATAAVLFGFTASAGAQARPAGTQTRTATSSGTTTTMPTFELGLGYQLLHTGQVCDNGALVQSCAPARTFPFGVAVDAVRNYGALGLVGEAGWSHKSDTDSLLTPSSLDVKFNTWHLAGGARWTSRKNAKLWPYGQVLAGVNQDRIGGDVVKAVEVSNDSVSHTSFMLQPGVGATYVLGDGWGVFGAVDYRRVFLKEDNTSLDAFRNFASGRNDIRVFLGVRMILD